MSAERSPTPWRINRGGLSLWTVDANGNEVYNAGPVRVPDNDFILRACNSHDALVATLESVLTIPALHPKARARIETALKAAKGEA